MAYMNAFQQSNMANLNIPDENGGINWKLPDKWWILRPATPDENGVRSPKSQNGEELPSLPSGIFFSYGNDRNSIWFNYHCL